MVHLKAFVLAGVGAVALSRAALAADLLPPPPAMEPQPPIVSADLGGWYLRGDVGVGVNTNSDLTSNAPVAAGYSDAIYNSSVSESALFDFGFGYQFNNWFRADVTGELRGGASFQGLEVQQCQACTTQYSDFYHGHVSSAIGLVNGYVDLGSWYGITPFVGAGVGLAVNRVTGATDQGGAVNPPGAPGQAFPVGGYFDNASKLNFAWALMAGFDMAVTPNLKLELGYRFLDYGKFTTGNSHCLNQNSPNGFACAPIYRVASKELYSNDFRIGLRYYLENPPPPEAPLVRKY